VKRSKMKKGRMRVKREVGSKEELRVKRENME
jgi:hypothetical protein